MGVDDRRGPPHRHPPLARGLRQLTRAARSARQAPLRSIPRHGRPYGTSFPELSVEDIASAAREALRTLGIARVACVVGPSLGGMTVLAYCTQYPDEVDALISISGAVSASAQAIALRALQREIVRSDPQWRNGEYEPGRGPRTDFASHASSGPSRTAARVSWTRDSDGGGSPEPAGRMVTHAASKSSPISTTRRSVSRRSSTRTAFSPCRAQWTSSISRSTAARSPRRLSVSAPCTRW